MGEPSFERTIIVRLKVYPHTRGGTGSRLKTDRTTQGLSPHAWGNLTRIAPVTRPNGSIPTRVGEPGCGRGDRQKRRVYPHTRGGTQMTTLFVTAILGLSPHAWGNRPGNGHGDTARAVYPHTRGGTRSPYRISSCVTGLSPHAWGNRLNRKLHCFLSGSIPTRVGEPDGNRVRIPRFSVYPHTRGGTPHHFWVFDTLTGLSPHAWGNPSRASCNTARVRSIPTRVGEPRSAKGRKAMYEVYPHTRGGTLGRRIHSDHAKRSIPTRVGEPNMLILTTMTKWVYPHTRGGTVPRPLPR